MLTRPLLAISLLSAKPFLVCSPQAMHAQETTASSTTDTSSSTTEMTTDSTTGPTSTGDPSTSTGPGMCGNGVQDPGEDCDDGNDSNEDACLNNCTAAKCGDEFVWAGEEECDDGDAIDTNSCTTACKMAVCGDEIVWEGEEECDDGAGNNGPGKACKDGCTANVCGDGDQGPGEECEDGNTDNDDGCSSTCKAEICGDGIKQANEECDDGNDVAGDGCAMGCVNDYPMFVTKDVYPANFTGVGGIADADAICQAAADGKLAGTYVAWLSVQGDGDSDDAKDDLPVDNPLVRTDGALIVADAADLTAGGMTVLMSSIDHDEDGNPIPMEMMMPAYAWTGTNTAGTYTGGDCEGWTAVNGELATVGALASTGPKWTFETNVNPIVQATCSGMNHLYCFRKAGS